MRSCLPALLFAAACGSGSSVPLAGFAEAYADARCAQAARCSAETPALQARCRTRLVRSLAADVNAAVAAGRVAYDPRAAAACVSGLASTACSAPGPSDATLSACLAALRGTLPPGASCSFLDECASGLCLPDASCPATCPPALGEGAACDPHGQPCDVRLGLHCKSGVCARASPLGGSCELAIDCASELVCGANQVCGPRRRAGEQCAVDENCQEGLYCLGGELSAACVQQLPEGAPCSEDGDHVDAALGGVECLEGLVCRGAGLTQTGETLSGHCARPAAVGAACLADPGGTQEFIDGCVLGLYCSAGACAPLPAEGPCAPHRACDPASYCDGQTCQVARSDGSRCAAGIECSSGACVSGACEEPVLFCHES